MIPQQRNTYDVLLVTNSYKDPVADSGLSTGRTLGASLVTFQHFLLLSLAWYSCCSLCQQCLATNLESDIDGYDMHCTVSVLYNFSLMLMLNVWYIYPTFAPQLYPVL